MVMVDGGVLVDEMRTMTGEFGGVSESQPGSVTHGIEYTNS